MEQPLTNLQRRWDAPDLSDASRLVLIRDKRQIRAASNHLVYPACVGCESGQDSDSRRAFERAKQPQIEQIFESCFSLIIKRPTLYTAWSGKSARWGQELHACQRRSKVLSATVPNPRIAHRTPELISRVASAAAV